MIPLRQSTEIKVRVGKFVDATNAITPETGITLGAADQAELMKADGAATVDISGATWAAVTGAAGWYDLTLTTSHTDTVGELRIDVSDESVCLPVFAVFYVVEEAVYDALYASGATGLLPANVTQWKGTAPADLTDTDKVQVSVQHMADAVITAAKIASSAFSAAKFAAGALASLAVASVTGAVGSVTGNVTGSIGSLASQAKDDVGDAVWDEDLTGHTTANSGGKVVSDMTVVTAQTWGVIVTDSGSGLTAIPWNSAWDAEVQSEVQDAIEANHLDHLLAVDYDPASKPGVSTALLNELVEDDSGVSRFTVNALENGPSGSGASAAAIADAVWDEALADHTTAGSAGEGLGNAGSGSSAADIADAVWDEARSGHTTAGTFGEHTGDAAMRGTDSAYTGTPPTAAAVRAEMDSNSTQLAAIVEDTNELQGDWVNGGRLDLLLDAVKAVTDQVPDSGAMTSIAQASALSAVASNVSDILTDTGTDIPALIAALNDISVADILTTAMTEDYAADGAAPTIAQALCLLIAANIEKSVAGTTVTLKKLDGSTTAATLTLDDATTPTSVTRAS